MAKVTVKPFNALSGVVEDLPTGNMGNALEAARLEELARQQRAIDLGFTQDAYHGSPREFKGEVVKPSVDQILDDPTKRFVSAENPELSDLYAKDYEKDKYLKGANQLPLKLNTEDYLIYDAKGKQWDKVNSKAIAEAKIKDKKGVRIENVLDQPGNEKDLGPQTVFISLDPSTVRSKFAQFDPAKKDESGLLLGKATPILTPVDYNPFDTSKSVDPLNTFKAEAPKSTIKLAGEALFKAAPAMFKPMVSSLSHLDSFIDSAKKSGAAGLESMATALENQYKPEGAVSSTDAGEWLDKEGKVLPSQYRPNVLPLTRKPDGGVELAMPAMLDVWNTLGGAGGKNVLGAGPSLRPALKYMDKIYKAKPGEQHLDALPENLRDTFQKQALSGEDISNFNFGFMNHKGQFLTREDALKYAIDNGILDPHDAKFGTLVTTMLGKSGGEGKLISQSGNAVREHPLPKHLAKINDKIMDEILTKAWDDVDKGIKPSISKINPNNTIPTQDWLTWNNWGNMANSESALTPLHIKPSVAKSIDGKYYTLDGHHRITNAIKNNLNEMDVHVIELDENQSKAFTQLYNQSGGEGKLVSQAGQAVKEKAPPFYSALENAVGGLNQAKASGEQWLGTLANQKGVKPDELEWTGLKEFLAGKKNVSKQEIQDYLKNNKVELKEVWKGKNSEYNALFDEHYKLGNESKNIPPGPKRDAMKKRFDELSIKLDELEKTNPTKYEKWQLAGGENYRELLLTLPAKEKTSGWKIRDNPDVDGEFEVLNDKGRVVYGTTDKDDALNYIKDQNKIDAKIDAYKSSHWDEPNILAHMRMNDRTIDGKKSLHIEEIQSDWHQQGREKGYKGAAAEKAYDELLERKGVAADKLNKIQNQIRKEISEGYDVRNLTAEQNTMLTKKYNDVRTANEEWVKARKDFDDVEREIQKGNPHMGVPDAPFKKNWHELALKRAIREAVDSGAERLSWTPGEAQAARYDLSKQINSIEYGGSDKAGSNWLTARDLNDNIVLQKRIDEKDLPDNIGKEATEKLLKQEPKNGFRNLENADLKIGGEGMKGFYDQIIPRSIEKIAKEFGVKVQKGEISKPETKLSYEEMQRRRNGEKPDPSKFKQPIFYIDIPPAMRKHAVSKGYPLFSHTPTLVPVNYNPFENEK